MKPTPPPPAPRSLEVRLGLVLYGGVSLAVYINGTCRELFDMARGRGIWGVLQELADADIVVDVISGASAGGINGLFLAHALAAERELEPLAHLWRDRAGFQQLLQKTGDVEARSLLDSAYMETELERAFRTMEQTPCDTSRELRPACSPEELDCFLAVTNYDGHVETIGDFRQRPVRVRSHATQIRLRHRRGRREPFGAEGSQERLTHSLLARLARATSAFPVAFEPVVLRGDEAGKLFAEGPAYLETDDAASFVDGGVLDNKPFTPVLPAIYERHATRPVKRLLFFVEPDPEEATGQGGSPTPGAVPEGPNFFQVATAALSTLPSYESIARDLEALDAHNRRIDLVRGVFGRTYGEGEREDPFTGEPALPPPCPPEQQRVYFRARLQQLIESAARELSATAIRDIECELARSLRGSESPPSQTRVSGFQRLFPLLCEELELAALLEEANDASATAEKRLDELDLDFHKRAYYYWIYALHEVLGPLVEESLGRSERAPVAPGDERRAGEVEVAPPLGDEAPENRIARLREAIAALSARVDMLLIMEACIARKLQAISTAREQAGSPPVEFREIEGAWRAALEASEDLAEVVRPRRSTSARARDQDSSRAQWTEEVQQFAIRYAERRSQVKRPQPSAREKQGPSLLAVFGRALDDILEGFWGLGGGADSASNSRLSALGAFRRIDGWRFPVFLASQLGEMDRIEYVRISPRDSVGVDATDGLLSRWDDEPMAKVCGRHLGHFGAFLKRSWRSNDILWGRLDAATIAFDTLVGSDRPEPLRLSRSRAKTLLDAPDRVAKLEREVVTALEKFVAGGEEAALRRDLLAHHQRSICREGLLTVMADAVHDELQRASAEYEVEGPGPGKPRRPAADDRDYATRYQEAVLEVLRQFHGKARDPLLRKLTAEALPRVTPLELDTFFRKHYDVGDESPRDLDPVGLATLGLHSARVFANMCRRLLPERGLWGRVQKGILGRASIGLTALHLGVRSIRNGSFPMVWFGTLLSTLLLLAAGPFLREGWTTPSVALFSLLVLLLLAPRFWFGERRVVKWFGLALALLFVLLLATFDGGQAHLQRAVAWASDQWTALKAVFATLTGRRWLAAAAVLGGATLLLASWRRRRKRRERLADLLRTRERHAVEERIHALDLEIARLAALRRHLDGQRAGGASKEESASWLRRLTNRWRSTESSSARATEI